MFFLMSAIVRRTLSEICSALEPGAAKMPIATAGLLSSSERSAYSEAPSSIRATSRSAGHGAVALGLDDDVAELFLARERPWALIESCRSVLSGAGEPPITPAAACTFWPRIARTTSLAERLCSATLPGSSQTRIA
jgi:hypothetical protein